MLKSKNDWFLVKIEKKYMYNNDTLYLECTYSNGLNETTYDFEYGKDIPSILDYTWFINSF